MSTSPQTYRTADSRRRIKAVLALLDRHGTLQSPRIATLLRWPPGTLGSYLKHMQNEGLIVPDDPAKTRYIFWSRPGADGKPSVLPEPAAMIKPPRKYNHESAKVTGKPIVRQVKAADVAAPAQNDPLMAALYGHKN